MDAGIKEVVSVYPDITALSIAAAEAFTGVVRSTASRERHCAIALAGGHTPSMLYKVLAAEYREALPWTTVHIFFGDERFVPEDDPQSNFRMAKEMLLDHIPIPPENIHPIETHFSSAALAARQFDAQLHEFFGGKLPSFDLVLLGIGTDGHTASIFPSTEEPEDTNVWAINTTSPAQPTARISLTINVIDNAKNVYFLISGNEKREIVKRLIEEKREVSASNDTTKLPSARVTAQEQLRYFLDQAAYEA